MALNINRKTTPADVDSSAKGDLIVNSGTDIISLPVGIDGKTLIADSNATEGIVWGDIVGNLGLYVPTPVLGAIYNDTAGSGNDIINAITILEGGNPVTTGSIDIFREDLATATSPITIVGTTDVENIVDQNTSTSGPGQPLNTFSAILIDWKNNPVQVSKLGIYPGPTPGGNYATSIYTSNDGTTWSLKVTQGNTQNTWNTTPTFPGQTIARYLRILFSIGGTGTGFLNELEVYGQASIGTSINYLLDSNWSNRYIVLSNVGTSSIQVDEDVTTLNNSTFITRIINNGLGIISIDPINTATVNGDLITQPGQVVTIIKIGTDAYYAYNSDFKLSNKGELETFDGINKTTLAPGTDGQIILADSTSTEGMSWADQPAVPLPTVALVGETITLTYVSDLDTNDLIYYIGTDKLTTGFIDPNSDGSILLRHGFSAPYTSNSISNLNSLTNRSLSQDYNTDPRGGYSLDLLTADLFRISLINIYSDSTTTIEVFGSTDDISYSSIGTTGSVIPGWSQHAIPGVSFYRYYRFVLTSGDNNLREIQLYGDYNDTVSPSFTLGATNTFYKIYEYTGAVNIDLILETPIEAGSYAYFKNSSPFDINISTGGGITYNDATVIKPNQLVLITADSLSNYKLLFINHDISTKGDLLSHDGITPTTLSVGIDNQVLASASTQTEGINWVDISTLIGQRVSAVDSGISRLYNAGTETISGGIFQGTSGVIHYIGTEQLTQAYSNPSVSGDIVVTVNGFANNNVTDKNTSNTSAQNAININNGSYIFFDLINPAYCLLEGVGIRLSTGSPRDFGVEGSNDNSNWFDVIPYGSKSYSLSAFNFFPATTSTFYRYFRIRGASGGIVMREVELYGTLASTAPVYQITEEARAGYLDVALGGPTQIDIPTGLSEGYYTYIVPNTVTSLPLTINALPGVTFINNITLNKVGEAALLFQLAPDVYSLHKLNDQTPVNKAGLITSDGTNKLELNAGTDGQILEADSAEVTGLKWGTKPLTTATKGDLITYDTTPALLGVGADGQVLLADSTTSEGIKWGELGGLNLTEVKYATTTTIDKTYPGGSFSTDLPGVLDFIGTDEDTVAYSNVATDDEVDILANGIETTLLSNKVYPSGGGIILGVGNNITIDLKRDAYIKPTEFGFTLGIQNTYTVEGSNDALGWDVLGVLTAVTAEEIITLTTNNFYRYIRLTHDGAAGSTDIGEIEVYGEIVPTSPTYEIVDDDNNKFLLVPFGNTTTINMPTGINDSGFVTQITSTVSGALPVTINPLAGVTFIGQNFTIDNMGEVATIVQVATDTYVVSISRGKLPLSAKGDILTHNGTEPVAQAIGSDDTVLTADSGEVSGVAWKDINTIVASPFTSQRLDISSQTQLTGSNARYLYVAASGGTQDLILTDPPSTNDFFYIVNRDGANPIQIKETAAGGVIQTINSFTPVCQAHYDGVEWEIISIGSI